MLTIFFNNEKKENFSIKNFITKFPKDNWFNFIESKKKDIILNPELISKYWIKAQEKIENYIFLKTHNALVSIEKNSFTNENHSLAAIHIVRDPRDVVVSYAKFLNRSYDKQIELLLTEQLHYNMDKKKPFAVEFLGSWKFHYNSWKNGCPKMKKIIIRYEDLLNDTKKEFNIIISFLSKILKFQPNNDQISFAINNSSFDFLSKQEKIHGFDEQNKQKEIFFRKGKKEQWKEELNIEQIKKIEKNLEKEMRELGYL